MSDHSGKVKCPDCTMLVNAKNLPKHYRRMHPDLDPLVRIKEAREAREKRVRSPRFESSNSMVIGALLVLTVVTVILVATLLVYSIFNDGGDALPPGRTIFYSASDGAVINGTWYQASGSGAPTVYLIHDIGKDRTVWRDYAQHLQSEGYNVLAIDLRGHGESVKNLRSQDIVYDWTTMTHSDFLLISNDIRAAVGWVQGDGPTGDPNTDAGEISSFIGVGKGGLYAMKTFSLLSRDGVISGAVLSPTLDCYRLDVVQVFEDWGDVRPILLAASEGDGTGNLAIDTILQRKENDGEENGEGVLVTGSSKDIDLLDNADFVKHLDKHLKDGWDTKPPS